MGEEMWRKKSVKSEMNCVIQFPQIIRIECENILEISSSLSSSSSPLGSLLDGDYLPLKVILSTETAEERREERLVCRIRLLSVVSSIKEIPILYSTISSLIAPNCLKSDCVIEAIDSSYPFYMLPIARTIVMSYNSLDNVESILSLLQGYLPSKSLAFHNQIYLRVPMTNSITGLQIKSILDRYNPKNHQYKGMKSILFPPFIINSSTEIIIESSFEDFDRELFGDSLLDQTFSTLTSHEAYSQTINGYLASLVASSMPSTDKTNNDFLSSVPSLLLSAPSGTGKTLLLRQQMKSFLPDYISFVRLSLGTLQPYTDTLLISFLNSVLARQPVVLLLDNLEYLVPIESHVSDRETSQYSNLTQILKQFLISLQNRKVGSKILVVGCCEKIELVDRSFLSLFPDVLSIPLPNPHQRELCLREVIEKFCSQVTFPGFDRQDQQQFSNLFKMNFLPYLSSILPNSIPLLDLCVKSQGIVRVELQLMLKQLKELDPIQYLSNLKIESEIDVMNQQVIGHTQIKEIILDSILLPRQYFALYQRFNINPTTGILLYGPPGTGKTFIASSIASSISGTFVNVKLSEIMSGQVGVAEQKIRDIFTYAKLCTPSIIFIDEFQAIFTSREGQGDNRDAGSGGQQMLTSALASCFDDIGLWNNSAGLQTMITIIAATNEPWAIDRGFFRSGRFDKVLHVGIMSKEDRIKLIQFRFDEMKKKGFDIDESVVVDELAEKLKYFTAADICHFLKVVFEEYLFSQQLPESCDQSMIIPANIFETILSKSFPSCREEEINEYIEWDKELRRYQ